MFPRKYTFEPAKPRAAMCRSGRWYEVVGGVGFEDDSLLSVVGPPFVEYDIARFYEPVRRSVHQTKSGSLLGEAKESAG
jgi:hypothetical protein